MAKKRSTKKSGRKYSKGASKSVEQAMRREKKGTLRSGRSGKKVTNPKQAIAIGLSEAREKGEKVPPPKGKRSAAKKKTSRKSSSSGKKSGATKTKREASSKK